VPSRGTLLSARLLRLGLGLIAIAALYGLSWLALAPNRLLPGEPVSAPQALGLMAHLAAFLIAISGFLGGRPAVHAMAIAALLLALVLALIGTGLSAKDLLQGRPPPARVSLGPGFWSSLAAIVLLALEHARAMQARWVSAVILTCVGAILVAGFMTGTFDHLSLVVEYKARLASVHLAFYRHIGLALGALALALTIALPLGWAAFRIPRVEAVANAVLGAVQVTPAIALFGLLVPLLAALLSAAPALREIGIGAVGPAPALIGVAVYVALPLLRGLISGLRATDPAAVEAAQAMGMTHARTVAEIRIPLGLPILIGAVRVAAVQSIGLMTLGGLIGAGGLGAIVFEGMSQLAADLILLGAIPIVGLALVVDMGMAWVNRMLRFHQ
jgi:osmoprotectant transport system permease protein